jgi:myo-inositol-1(or 4)-monophosphatase
MSQVNQTVPLPRALVVAVAAARAAGALMRAHRHSKKKINASSQHDIKLELDVRCQTLIERKLRPAFPDVAILGEEGMLGDPLAPARWVVDPIDGTVNFTYGIPHACVSIALEFQSPRFKVRGSKLHSSDRAFPQDATRNTPEYQAIVGVVYDPFCDELWTAVRGGPARLNGRIIRVSDRRKLDEAVISIGFSKERATLEKMLPGFNRLVHRVRKIRIMGAAALALTYVASGRMDAYVEFGLSLWDIAAGGLIVECAGGESFREPIPGQHKFRILASNGLLRRRLAPLLT